MVEICQAGSENILKKYLKIVKDFEKKIKNIHLYM
jgi:hypothetical protein